jgi:hypothetical protein
MNDQHDQRDPKRRVDSRMMTDLASAWSRWLSLPAQASTHLDEHWLQQVELCAATIGVAGREIRRCLEADATAAQFAEACDTVRDAAAVLLGLVDSTHPEPPPRTRLRLVPEDDSS